MKKKLTIAGTLVVLLSASRIVFPALGGLHENLALLTIVYKNLKRHPDTLAVTILVLFVLVLLLLAALAILHERLEKGTPEHACPLSGPTRFEKTALGPADLKAGLEYCAASAAKYVPDLIVGVNRGGAIVGGYVARSIHMAFVQLVQVIQESSGEERLIFPNRLLLPQNGLPVEPGAAVNILVVDDSHWSGSHMKETTDWIRKKYRSARIRTLVLVYLDARRPGAPSHPVDDCAFITRDGRCELPWDAVHSERFMTPVSEDSASGPRVATS